MCGIEFPQIFISAKTLGFITLIVFSNAVISSLSHTSIHAESHSSGIAGPNVHNYFLDQTHSQISRGHYLRNPPKQVTASSAIKLKHKRDAENVKENAQGPSGSLFSGIHAEWTQEYEDAVNSYLNLLLAQEEANCLRDFVSFFIVLSVFICISRAFTEFSTHSGSWEIIL